MKLYPFHGFAFQELPENIPYLKIYTVGHQVPDDDTIFKFKTAVNGFLKENKDNGECFVFLFLFFSLYLNFGMHFKWGWRILIFLIVLTLGLFV